LAGKLIYREKGFEHLDLNTRESDDNIVILPYWRETDSTPLNLLTKFRGAGDKARKEEKNYLKIQ